MLPILVNLKLTLEPIRAAWCPSEISAGASALAYAFDKLSTFRVRLEVSVCDSDIIEGSSRVGGSGLMGRSRLIGGIEMLIILLPIYLLLLRSAIAPVTPLALPEVDPRNE